MNDQLSPEEQAELQALEAEFTPTDEAPLSAEEQAELAELEAQDVNSSEFALPSQDQVELKDKITPKQVTDDISTIGQIGEIVSDQVPFLDHARAGSIAFLNNQFGDGTKSYTQVKNEIDTKQAAIQAEHPYVAGGTRIATEAGLLISGAGLATKALKGVQAVSKFAKLSKAASINIGTDFSFSVAQELSKEDGDLLDNFDEALMKGGIRAAEGAAYGIALGGALKIFKGSSDISGLSTVIKNKIVSNNVAGMLKSQAVKLRGYAKNAGRSFKDITKSLDEVGEGAIDYTKPLDIVKFVETSGGNSTALRKAGSMQGEVVSKIDAAVGATLDGKQIANNVDTLLENKIIEQGSFASEELLKQRDSIRDMLFKNLANPDGTAKLGTASQLMTLKQTLRDRLESLGLDKSKPLAKQILKEVNDGINNTIEGAASRFDLAKAAQVGDDTVVTTVKEVSEPLIDQFKKARKRFTDIKILSEVADASGAEVGGDKIFNSIKKGFVTSLFLGQGAQTVGAVASVANTLINSPASLGNALNATTRNASKIVGLGNFLAENAKDIRAMGALSSRLYTLFTDPELDYESANAEFDDLIEQGSSYQKLFEAPLARTEIASKERIEDIYNVVRGANKPMAKELMDAYTKGEDIGPIMVEISKRPEARGLIEEGDGWNGKVYSKQDKTAAVSRLRTHTLLPAAVRIAHEKNIMSTGNLPAWEQLPKREPMKIQSKNKGKGSF